MVKSTPPIVFALSIERDTGAVSIASNLETNSADLPLLYKALRAVENQVFEDIEGQLPATKPLPARDKGEKVDGSDS